MFGSVALGRSTGVSARAGLRARWTIATSDGEIRQPYLSANFWRDWDGEATVTYSSIDEAQLREDGQRLEVGGGVTAKINANTSLYANGYYQFAVGDALYARRDGVKGAGGIRYVW